MSKTNLRPNVLNENRWTEIRFYYFCFGLYKHRQNLMDVVDTVESLCYLFPGNTVKLRNLAAKTLSDFTYTPQRIEVLVLCRKNKYSLSEAAELIEVSRRTVINLINAHKDMEDSTFYPKYSPEDIELIKTFMESVDYLRRCII